MFGSESERKLRRLFKAEVRVRPEHKSELEREILARFEARVPTKERPGMTMIKSVLFRRIAVASAAAVILGVVACSAPADVDVDVGRSVDISYAMADGMPDPREVVEHVKGQGPFENVTVRVRREGEKVSVHLDVWGSALPEGPLGDGIRKTFPALKDAAITEEDLQGKVRGTLGEKLGHDLLDLDLIDATDVEAARQQVMEQLAASGVQGAVDVKVENEGGKRKIQVRVEREDCDPPPAAAEP